MIRAAREVILVADSNKWQVERLIRIAEIQTFHKLLRMTASVISGFDALQARQIEVITPRTGFPTLSPTMEEYIIMVPKVSIIGAGSGAFSRSMICDLS
ncbi:MAG: hypothetical protein ABSE06_15810 [Anaerolineaceae bacterium]|jgi:hypothetical protein